MRRGFSTAILPLIATIALSGCAAPPAPQDADSGGPTFIQMPVDSQALVGATPQLLSAAFGKPAILRVDGTAQVWLYHAAGCGLNLVLYPDSAGTPRVAMAAPTDDGGDTAACSAALARDHVAGLNRPIAQSGLVQPAAAQIQVTLPVSDPTQPAAPPPASAQPGAADPSLDGPGTDDTLERPSSS